MTLIASPVIMTVHVGACLGAVTAYTNRIRTVAKSKSTLCEDKKRKNGDGCCGGPLVVVGMGLLWTTVRYLLCSVSIQTSVW